MSQLKPRPTNLTARAKHFGARLFSGASHRGLSGVAVAFDGSGDAATGGDAQALVEQNFFEGGEKKQDVGVLVRVAHQADAPDFAFHCAEAAGDLDVEFVEKLLADFAVVDAGGNGDAGHSDQAVGGIGDEKFEAPTFEAGDEGLLIGAVAIPAGFETLFKREAQRFAHGENQRDGRSVVIRALAAPHGHDRHKVEIPAGHGRFARFDGFFHPRVHGDGRHSRRTAKRFLRAAETNIDFLLVDVERNTSQSCDRVNDQQGAEFVGYFAVIIQILHHAAGGFAVSEADEFNFFALARAADVFGIDGSAVGRFDANHFRAGGAFRDHRHAFGEPAIGADDTFVAGLEDVHDRGFDAARAGRGNGIGDAVLSLEDAAQHDLHVAHHFGEPRIHVADQRSGQGAVHARVHVGGAGSEHQARGGKKFAEDFSHVEVPRSESYAGAAAAATSSRGSGWLARQGLWED